MYPPKRATIINGTYLKSTINPNSNLTGNAIQKMSVTEVNNTNRYLLKLVNPFSMKITAIRNGKSKNKKFNNKVSIKRNHLPTTLIT